MVAVSIARTVVAQGPPPPPPLQPLAAPVAPAGNPITTDKTQLESYVKDMPEDKYQLETLELINGLYPKKSVTPGQLFKIVQ